MSNNDELPSSTETTGLADPTRVDPFPVDERLTVWPDWWKCLRFGPVSGRYNGAMTAPDAGKFELDLRVDIDLRHANSPIMNRVSGDFWQVYSFNWWGRTYKWRVYRESWVVDNPKVAWSRCSVKITGKVRYYKGRHFPESLKVVIPWSGFKLGPANVQFETSLGGIRGFSCDKKSSSFREVNLEVDVCNSVNSAPVIPTYDTDSHPTRPTDLPQRSLTIEEAYAEAGIDVAIRPERTIIDDSAAKYTTWSDAELHDAMEDHFSQYSGSWPKWELWGVLAGSHDSPGMAGIMFDYGTAYGGPGRAPERQGFAVFRNHSWYDDLPASAPANDAEAWALRQFLYTWVHEAGHAFNYVHSWNKSRPNALSWMNYPQYVANFWDNFRFRFDDEELIHLRHGDRSEIIMGGDPWATGSHLESPSAAMVELEGDSPIELLIRSKSYFDFLEPVTMEFRLRNKSELPLSVDTLFHPDFGRMTVYIRRPDGRTLEYAPIACKLASPELRELKPAAEAANGADRYSQNVALSFGQYGFYFDEPGQYQVRAMYHGNGDVLIPSNIHSIRIGRPFDREEDRMAQDYFRFDTGMTLYLDGSNSQFLKKGMETLETIADRLKQNASGAQLALVLARNSSRPFYQMEKGKRSKVRDADPDAALALTQQVLDQQQRDSSTLTNIDYHECRRIRAASMASKGDTDGASDEMKVLEQDLKHIVKKSVLAEIDEYAKTLLKK